MSDSIPIRAATSGLWLRIAGPAQPMRAISTVATGSSPPRRRVPAAAAETERREVGEECRVVCMAHRHPRGRVVRGAVGAASIRSGSTSPSGKGGEGRRIAREGSRRFRHQVLIRDGVLLARPVAVATVRPHLDPRLDGVTTRGDHGSRPTPDSTPLDDPPRHAGSSGNRAGGFRVSLVG